MSGSLSVLNVGAGDISITFNQHDTGERAKALRMLKDMQKRGYAILVRLDDGTYTRAVEIDETRGCYVIQEPEELPAEPTVAATGLDDGPPLKKRRGRPRGPQRRSVPIEHAHATGVARSAGG